MPFKLSLLAICFSVTVGVALLTAAAPSLAQSTCPLPDATLAGGLRRAACVAGFINPGDTSPVNETTIVTIIGGFISIALGFTGVVFVILVIYGGWLWGTARGNEEQVTEAEQYLRNATIGIILVFAAFVISRAVMTAIYISLSSVP